MVAKAGKVDRCMRCNYSNYMKPVKLKIARIGNSRGVRLPAATLERYQIGESVVMEERSDGILLRPAGMASPKLSWEDTAREMAASGEDWEEWDITISDGLDDLPWEHIARDRVAEPPRAYKSRRGKKK